MFGWFFDYFDSDDRGVEDEVDRGILDCDFADSVGGFSGFDGVGLIEEDHF